MSIIDIIGSKQFEQGYFLRWLNIHSTVIYGMNLFVGLSGKCDWVAKKLNFIFNWKKTIQTGNFCTSNGEILSPGKVKKYNKASCKLILTFL